MLFSGLFTAALEDAFQRFLGRDAKTRAYLDPLAGKVFELRLQPLNYPVYLCPTPSGVQVLERIAGRPDAILSGSPLAFALMGRSGSRPRARFAGDVKIEGDVEAARCLQVLFGRLDIDWEALLARYAGSALAGQLIGLFRSSQAWRRECIENLRLDIAEYWQEETRDLPAPAEADWFSEEVDALRAAQDRLAARIERLQAALALDPSAEEPR